MVADDEAAFVFYLWLIDLLSRRQTGLDLCACWALSMGAMRARGGYCCCYVLELYDRCLLLVLCSSEPWVFWCVVEVCAIEGCRGVAPVSPC